MPSVIVVGGGLAGLVCAWRLVRAGHEVEVLEREWEPGGGAARERRGSLGFGAAPRIALASDANLAALVSALAGGPALEPVVEPTLGLAREGRLHPCDASSAVRLCAGAPLAAASKLRLLALGIELRRLRALLDPERASAAAPLDRGAAGPRLRRRVGDEAWTWLVAPLLEALLGDPDALAEATALRALRRLQRGLAPRRLVGGTPALVAALGAVLRVRTGCEVVRVETETDGARVRYERGGRPRSALADAVVVALPAPSVPALCPKLAPDERGFLAARATSPRLRADLVLERPLPEATPPLMLFPAAESAGVRAAIWEPGGAAAAGRLALVLDAPSSRDLAAAPDGAVVAHALHGLARTPLGRLEAAHARVERGLRADGVLAPGGVRALAAFESRVERSPRLVLAVEGAGAGLEAEVTRGARAATEVARALAP